MSLLGRNGAGRSTAVKTIIGLVPPAGTIRFRGERIAGLLKTIVERSTSILLVEQKLTIALSISHRLYVMGHGRIVFEGTPADLHTNTAVLKEWLEV